MALILDKTITGVTSAIVVSGITTDFYDTVYTEDKNTKTGWIESWYSGNTFVKTTYTTGYTNLSYSDKFGGEHKNPYLIVTSVNVDRIKTVAIIGISIYINKESKDNNMLPIEQKTIELPYPPEFNKYFSVEVLENTSVYQKAYDFLNDRIYQGWKSDE
jgi:hypothetical protein